MLPHSQDYKIKQLHRADYKQAQALFTLLSAVFETEDKAVLAQDATERLLDDPSFLVFVATLAEEVVGGLTAYVLPLYRPPYAEVFIYDIGVSAPHRRNGIGKKLLVALQDYCSAQFIGSIFVAAHEEDLDAVEFYKGTQGQPERVIHFTYTSSLK